MNIKNKKKIIKILITIELMIIKIISIIDNNF